MLSIFGQQPKLVLNVGMIFIVKAPVGSQKKKTRSLLESKLKVPKTSCALVSDNEIVVTPLTLVPSANI